MNTEKPDIEQLRKAWVEMGKALGMQPIPVTDTEHLGKKKTALERLRHKYLTFWIISLLMTFGGFLIFSNGIFVTTNLNQWLAVAYATYFFTAFCMDFWLWKGLGTIDPLQMSVSEIAQKSILYRKRHLQFMTILIPLAIALVSFMGYAFSSEKYFLNGMIVGCIIGIIIGTIQFRRFMAEYRNLTD